MQPELFSKPPRVITVGEFTLAIQTCLAAAFPMLWVSGEVSGLKRHQNGHLYFTLKDQEATLPCVVWRKAARVIEQLPQEGDHVEILGRLDLYPPHGRYQFLIDNLRPKGRGELYAAFERMKARLSAQGLFARERKRPLPILPRKIGIVTSPSGAAIRDMLKIIGARDPLASVVLAPAQVQGRGAAASIRAALRLLAQVPEVDVVIVGRGGGSLEDLWAFNEEPVARAIFEHPVPVVSAVGHETDITIADLVADLRASTPSHAAELVAPPRAQFLLELRELSRRAQRAVQRQLHEAKASAELLRERLPEPSQEIAAAKTELRDLAGRLERAAQDKLQGQRENLRDLSQRLAATHPRGALLAKRAALASDSARLSAAYHARLVRERDKRKAQHALLESVSERLFAAQEAKQKRSFERLGRLADTLHALSPLAVLSRGYALASRQQRTLRRAQDLRPGDSFDLRLAEGSLRCQVLSVNENET